MVLGCHVKKNNYASILDIGAGTGVIGLMAVQLNPDARLIAIDTDGPSIEDCTTNFRNASFLKDYEVRHEDVLSYEPSQKIEFIISNPPYYHNALQGVDARQNNAKHISGLPLDKLFTKVYSLLADQGEFACILPFENHLHWVAVAQETNLFLKEKITIHAKPGFPKRVILFFDKVGGEVSQSDFVIRDEDNKYSDEYILKTKDFHFNDLTQG